MTHDVASAGRALVNPFSDPDHVLGYTDRVARTVPGYADLQRMARLLLAERVPDNGQVLVVGAGGGLELKAFAQAQPGWRFVGVDPSAPMLRLAERTLGADASRVALHEGYVDTAPEGPFDGATCLLTLHFLSAADRAATLREIRRRLKSGAPLVVAHHSIAEDHDERALWLSRFGAFAADAGLGAFRAPEATQALHASLPILSPEADEHALADAGFSDVRLFWAAFTFRGWVAYA